MNRRLPRVALEERFGFKGRKSRGFSLDDRVHLGLTNTVYLGPGSYERDSLRFRRHLALITADECRALVNP